MSDVKELIRRITEEVMRKTAKNIQDKIYSDEPLIFTASQMKSFVPDEIREMKKLASEPSAYYQTEACVFCRQAKFMEKYEDDFEYNGNFFTYYPTYQKMNNDQLRGYFSWRSKVRKGEIEKTPLSFVYVYIYELINMIGSDSPEEGFHKLKDFCDVYSKLEPQILRYVKTWLVDFAVYYNIDKALLGDLADEGFDRALSVLQDHEAGDDDELFEAVCALSSYDIRNYKLYKKYPDDVREVICGVFRQCSDHYLKKNKKNLCEKLFGLKTGIHYHMFESAVFYDEKKYTDYSYEINGSHKFVCRNGSWSCEKYYGNHKSQWLGDVLKASDSVMRQRLDFGNPINCPVETKWILNVISKEIDALLENKKKNTTPKIEIDISKLAGIRKSADITRDKLMTDEEREEITHELPAEIPEVPEETEKFPPKNDTPLDDNEYGFLHSLLYGGSFESRIMPSILADSINEKLYDIFGDVVIIFEGDKPLIIEDYAEELKGMILE